MRAAERRRAHETVDRPKLWRPGSRRSISIIGSGWCASSFLAVSSSRRVSASRISSSPIRSSRRASTSTSSRSIQAGCFPQTYELWEKTEARYARRIRAYYPQARRLKRSSRSRASTASTSPSTRARPAAISARSNRCRGACRRFGLDNGLARRPVGGARRRAAHRVRRTHTGC